ncbi:MAG: class I SAM-dependent methyltransferase [Pseudomonadota bacterium]|nr:class I SAM-dependent methyltransferase [Pseudomonadota bacterium]
MTEQKGFDASTLAYYADVAPTYKASGEGGLNRFLPEFMRLLPTGAAVLDLGCGGGRDSEALLANGYEVTSWDASERIALEAQKRLGRAVFVKRFDELEVEREFDAVWASASLLHVPLTDLPNVLERVHTALRPRGLHFASYKSGGIEGRDAVGRYFNFISRKQLEQAYSQSANWQIHEIHEYVGGGYDHGQSGPWIAVIASKL